MDEETGLYLSLCLLNTTEKLSREGKKEVIELELFHSVRIMTRTRARAQWADGRIFDRLVSNLD